MKHSGSLIALSLLTSGALAASAQAATVPLQIPGLADAKVPAAIGLGLDASWQHPVFPAGAPANAASYSLQQTSALSDGATCVRGVWAVGVALKPKERPTLAGDTLRLPTEGSLLPRMKVDRRGTAGATRWYAGALRHEAGNETQQGVAVLPAPSWAVRGGRSVVAVRVATGLNVRHDAPDGSTLPVTDAERSECYTSRSAQLGPQLRTLLRRVTVRRRPSPAS